MDFILLTNIIEERGFTKNEIAEQLGLSRQGLYNKLNGEKEFKASEIRKLSRLLNLSDSDKNQIFFNDYVDEFVNQSDTDPSYGGTTMLKQTGAMGYFTDFISASSQVKCKPIVDKFFSELCSMELTQQEAQCITVSLNCMVSDEMPFKKYC